MRGVAQSAVPQAHARRAHTNNVTERVIGRSKIRYKTIRGYESVEGTMNGLWLTQRVWGECGMDMGELLAA